MVTNSACNKCTGNQPNEGLHGDIFFPSAGRSSKQSAIARSNNTLQPKLLGTGNTFKDMYLGDALLLHSNLNQPLALSYLAVFNIHKIFLAWTAHWPL